MAQTAESVAQEPRKGTWAQMAQFPRAFYMVNVMEMFERLAYYGVRVVIPIYIAQADEATGLHFTQSQKGFIFFLWALVQTGVPIFSGGFADRYGYKRTIAVALAISIGGYFLMGTQRGFWPFTLGCLTLALGTAIFKPGLQGTLVRTLTPKTSGVGWGVFYMLVNIGGFLGPPLAHFLRGLSWSHVFFGSAAILSLNYLMLFTYPAIAAGGQQSGGALGVATRTFRNLVRPKLILFILIMSGFWLMFMQLFDMLPNFIVDWVDTRSIVQMFHVATRSILQMLHLQMLHLGGTFTSVTPRGTMIAQEWMINIDSGLIVLCVVWISAMVTRMRRVTSIFIGILIASAGLLVSGSAMAGWICVAGIAIFAVGEMLASPKMSEYLGVIAPMGEKALYMGYSNMPFAVGWSIGSLLGGSVYDRFGDKANLALRYLQEHGTPSAGIARTEAMDRLVRSLGTDQVRATQVLWNAYHPYLLWLPFVGLGLLSAVGIYFYSQWVKADEAAADARG